VLRRAWTYRPLGVAALAFAAGLPGCSDRGGGSPVVHFDASGIDAGERIDAGPPPLDAGPPPVDVGVRDAPFDPDAACALATADATIETLPVDIIWMVDNSVSMSPAIDQVTAGLNTFATSIDSRGLDYRVIMLSLRSPTNPVTIAGGTRYAVCIPPPLAGDATCGNGPRFFQSSIDIRSTQPLEQFLGTLGQTAGFTPADARGGEPWHDFLRPEATKTIVVVTDDNARLAPSDFEHFAGGTNPFNSTMLPPGILDVSWGGLFDGYTFDGLYGWGSDTDPGVRCTYPDASSPPSSGNTYTSLVSSTGGVRAQICDGAAAWGPFFDAIATAVVRTSRVSCDLPIPPPPDGMLFDSMRVNVSIVGGSTTSLGKVRGGAASCGAMGGWYYDSDTMPMRVVLCPASCDLAQTELRASGTARVQVQFGCESVLI